MPLTPADVHNVGFSKAPIGRRGYDPEEVDAFLFEIERELDRLIGANLELRAVPGSRGEPSTPDEQGLTAERDRLRGEVQRVREETAAAQRRARRLRQLLRSRSEPGEHQALDVLVVAEESAQEQVADARREAEQLLSTSQALAEEVTGKARELATSLEREVRGRYQEALGPLEEQMTALQAQIERLKTFEREYHARLGAYVQSRLRELAPPDEEAEAAVNPPGAQPPAAPPRQAS